MEPLSDGMPEPLPEEEIGPVLDSLGVPLPDRLVEPPPEGATEVLLEGGIGTPPDPLPADETEPGIPEDSEVPGSKLGSEFDGTLPEPLMRNAYTEREVQTSFSGETDAIVFSPEEIKECNFDL